MRNVSFWINFVYYVCNKKDNSQVYLRNHFPALENDIWWSDWQFCANFQARKQNATFRVFATKPDEVPKAHLFTFAFPIYEAHPNK